MLAPEALEATLRAAFPDATLELEDLTGTRDHYSLTIASSAFTGLSPIAQHRLVYAALGDALRGPVHALALHTFTPEAWARRSALATAPPRTPE
jgi:stress-induced morphogen